MLNSFGSRITNTTKEFSWAPKMSFSEMVSKPRMFLKKLKGTITFKQLKNLANANRWRYLNKQMDMVSSNVKFINFTFLPVSNLPQKEFTIRSEPIKFKGVFCVFNFPDKMESILSEAMLLRFQIHVNSLEYSSNYTHQFISKGLGSNPNLLNIYKEINLMEHGDSSLCLKALVS